jgi:Domain of unknown function (DUF4148)
MPFIDAFAMSTVHPIDEPHANAGDSPSQDKTANNNKAARPELSSHFCTAKEIIMNSKLLYAATVAVALLGSGLAMASEATQFDNTPGTLTRDEVKAELARAQAASRTLGREVHYVGEAAVFEIPSDSTLTRAEAASRVLGRTVIFNEATTFVDTTPADERADRVLARSFK